jgi:hypothetical protein
MAKHTSYPVEFSTREYEMAHGKQPRGQGSWAFCPAQAYNLTNYLDHVKWFSGTFAQARKQAKEHFGANPGTPRVVVCS